MLMPMLTLRLAINLDLILENINPLCFWVLFLVVFIVRLQQEVLDAEKSLFSTALGPLNGRREQITIPYILFMREHT